MKIEPRTSAVSTEVATKAEAADGGSIPSPGELSNGEKSELQFLGGYAGLASSQERLAGFLGIPCGG